MLPGYFEAMGRSVIEGRTFTSEDNRPDVRVMVIDRILAAKAFPGQPRSARRCSPGRGRRSRNVQVIGVVDHQRHDTLGA